ncbi:MAG: Fic family protein [Planctomycetota bacterium]|nr:Fic family protein [Planctomycetota bacterium]
MRYFDYSFLEQGMLPAGMVNLIGAITELRVRGAERRGDYPDVFTRLESIAKVQSVHGSNAIEGIVTSESRINAIVIQNAAPLNHAEEEIAGYSAALNMIHTGFDALDIRERDILRLHEVMLSFAPQGGGRYKESDNTIMEVSAAGRRSVRFSPTPASETGETMEQLVLAYMDSRDNPSINRLLLIPCFILDFLCIHPFADGNGRMSRLLSLLLLYKNGFDAGKYISFEAQINASKALYYQALKDSSANWHTANNDYFAFMSNFLVTLLKCYKELDTHFAAIQSGKVSKKQRIEATVLHSLLPISKREICYILPDVSPTTVESVLAQMLGKGVIEKIGSARNTKYIARQ